MPAMHEAMRTTDVSGETIRVGVLIIGSLYWDEEEPRRKWRQDRLAESEKKRVRAPIRYGRLSRSRGCSYTMVFSKQLDPPDMPDRRGWAYAVPCKVPVNSVDDLVTEARLLWRAEGGEEGRISAKWGCVALLENPERPMPDKLRTGWTENIRREGCYAALNSAVGETTVVNNEGFLTTSWPGADADSDLVVDALLATATDPTLVRGDYPSVSEIAAAWNAQDGDNYDRYVRYFRQNRRCGIHTFQDGKIEQALRSP